MTVQDEDPGPAAGARRQLVWVGAAVALVVIAGIAVIAIAGADDGSAPASGSAPATSTPAGSAPASGGRGTAAGSGTATGSATPRRGASSGPAATGSGRPPSASAPATGLAASPTSVDVSMARQAACAIDSASISALINPPADEPQGVVADRLRDAVPTLDSNLAGWTDAARGRPQLAAAVAVVSRIESSWAAALVAYDRGDEQAGQKQVTAAAAEIARLDATVAAARAALGARC